MAKRIGESPAEVGFLQKLFIIDDVTKYRGIPLSRYFLIRYIIVGHFLIQRILTHRANRKMKSLKD